MPHVRWTPAAERDLDEIVSYIAIVDCELATGERVYLEVIDKAARQAESVFAGHRYSGTPEGWLIFYEPSIDGIEVMRVLDAARAIPRQLRHL